MKLHRAIFLLLINFTLCASAAEGVDSIRGNERNWWQLLKRLELDVKDTTVVYPPFIRSCVNLYNTAYDFLESQDTAYVGKPDKSWNVHLVNQNWRDAYYFNFNNGIPITMLSEIYSNAGAYASYSFLSLGYSVDLNNMFDRKSYHKRYNFGINCARFNLEAKLWENSGGTYIRTFGKYNDGKPIKVFFPGATQRTVGLSGYYFFKHREFSMAAAYNFSKFQKRSAGSPVLGFNMNRIDVTLDFNQLPQELHPWLTFVPELYRLHYNAYTVMAGYSYNWAFNRHILLNLSLFPGFGYTHSYDDSYYGSNDLVGMSFNGASSLTYNADIFFVCASLKVAANIFQTSQLSLIAPISNGEISLGFRF